MRKILGIAILLTSILSLNSCEDPDALTPFEEEVVEYFKDVALGFEFGGASEITRKWAGEMKIFVGGDPDQFLIDELNSIISEVNSLTTDGFSMSVVTDTLQSNYYIFFGPGDNYADLFPDQQAYVANNWGLFSIYWNGSNQLFRGYMYVDTERPDAAGQRHLLREELTQSLGLAKDSEKYSDSIFQQQWTTTTSYAEIDRELIRLLYHPDMQIGLDAAAVDALLRQMLMGE